MYDYRQTELTLEGRAVIVFTEAHSARDLKSLEARHTKAVKAALIAWRAGKAEARYADDEKSSKGVRKAAAARHVKLGFEYGTPEVAGDNAVRQHMAHAAKVRDAALKAAKNFPDNGGKYVDCRKGDAPVRFTTVDPDVFAASLEGVTHEYVTDAPVPAAEAPVAAPVRTGMDYLRELLSLPA
jgi:hypothetical protein